MAGLLGSLFESTEAESVRPVPPITPPTGPPSPSVVSPVQDITPNPTKIVVVGLGGAGNNTLNRLSSIGATGTELVAINTDKVHLDSIQVEHKILAGYEITKGFGKRTAPEGVATYAPAFDVTPAHLITALITEKGVVETPTTAKIKALLDS